MSPAQADPTWAAVWYGDDFVYERNEYVCMDSSLNVYTAGRMVDQLGAEDILVIKCNADGVEQWTRRFRSLDGGEDVNDIPYDMQVDSVGNCVATGGSNNTVLTVKYDSAGSELWSARYDPEPGVGVPSGVDVDAAGNV